MTETQKIKFYRAFLKRDVRTFSDMAPYLAVEIGGVSKKTMTDQKGGKKPTWNETLEFKTASTLMKVSVFDKNTFNDQLIGKATFDLKTTEGLEKEETIDIEHDQQVVGKLFIKIMSKPNFRYPSLNHELNTHRSPISENDRKTLESAACNLLSKSMEENSNPLNILAGSPQYFPQPNTQMYQPPPLSPQPLMYSPQVMAPQMQIPYYPSPQYAVYPQQRPSQAYHYSSVPANMVLVQNSPNPGALSANRNLNQNKITVPQFQKGKNNKTFSSPFQDLTDLLL